MKEVGVYSPRLSLEIISFYLRWVTWGLESAMKWWSWSRSSGQRVEWGGDADHCLLERQGREGLRPIQKQVETRREWSFVTIGINPKDRNLLSLIIEADVKCSNWRFAVTPAVPGTEGRQLMLLLSIILFAQVTEVYPETIKVPTPKGETCTLQWCLGYGERGGFLCMKKWT